MLWNLWNLWHLQSNRRIHLSPIRSLRGKRNCIYVLWMTTYHFILHGKRNIMCVLVGNDTITFHIRGKMRLRWQISFYEMRKIFTVVLEVSEVMVSYPVHTHIMFLFPCNMKCCIVIHSTSMQSIFPHNERTGNFLLLCKLFISSLMLVAL